MLEVNKALVRRYREEYYNRGRLEVAAELFGEHVVLHGEQLTREEFTGVASAWRTAFPDLTFTIELLVAEGNHVVEYTRASGTHQGDFYGLPPTGKPIDGHLAYIHRIEAGRIVETFGLIDTLGLYQQLGIISLPE